jgi:DNA-binding transcriptional ArsR family regulator
MKPGISAEVQELAQRQAALCKVFSNAQRVLILWFLVDRERTVSEIAEAISSSLPSASQHLRLMELSNIVESRRERHNIYYHIAENELLENCVILANRPREKLMEFAST